MTVPPLFGWETIALGLVILVVLAVAAVALLGAGKAKSERSEWEAWLNGRSAGRPDRSGVPEVSRQPRGSGVEA
jgi:hypothetical protein